VINDQTRISQLILEFGTISISIELMSRQDKGKKNYSECSIISILHLSPYLECDLSKIFLE
jgi:hypothetical protein